MNYGVTPGGTALRQADHRHRAEPGSDLTPCNRVHLELARRVRDGIRDAGRHPDGIPGPPDLRELPAPDGRHRPQPGLHGRWSKSCYGYPIDAVVLTTGCDKTHAGRRSWPRPPSTFPPSCCPAARCWTAGTKEKLVGSGHWRSGSSRPQLAAGEIDEEKFLQRRHGSAPSVGHCNTMGTASTMNAVAEALGLSLTGCAAIPAPYRERGQMAYETGRRIVEMAYRGPAALEDPARARRSWTPSSRQRRDRRLDQRPAAHHRHGASCRRGAAPERLDRVTASTCRCC